GDAVGVERGREHEGGGALRPAVVLPGFDDDADPTTQREQCRPERRLEAERPVRPGDGALPEQDHELRVDELHETGDRAAEEMAGRAEEGGRGGVAAVRRRGERRHPGLVGDDAALAGRAHERRLPDAGLEAPRVAATAARAVLHDRRVPDLARTAGGAAEYDPVDHDGGAHTGTDRDDEEALVPPPGAVES